MLVTLLLAGLLSVVGPLPQNIVGGGPMVHTDNIVGGGPMVSSSNPDNIVGGGPMSPSPSP